MSVGHSRRTSLQPLAAPLRRVGQQLLQLALDALLLDRRERVELVLDVGEHLRDRDLEQLLLAALAHEQTLEPTVLAVLLLDHGRRDHPVQRLDVGAAAVGPHHERAVGS